MSDRLNLSTTLAAGACACVALAATFLPAQPCEARRQDAAAAIVRTPPAVNDGPWRPEYYYLDPRPDTLFESVLAALSRDQMMTEDRYSTAVMLGMLLAQNPERTAEWAEALDAIPEQNKSTVWSAMAAANTDEAVMALDAIKRADQDKAPTVDYYMQSPPRDIVSEPFNNPNRLTELWAAYFVSGDPIYVRRVIQALEWAVPEEDDEMKVLIGGGAYWSLARNCFAHTRVLAICREELKTSDGRVQRSLEAVLDEAEKRLKTEPCPEPKPAATTDAAKP